MCWKWKTSYFLMNYFIQDFFKINNFKPISFPMKLEKSKEISTWMFETSKKFCWFGSLELSKFCWIPSNNEFSIVRKKVLGLFGFSEVKIKIPFFERFIILNSLLTIEKEESERLKRNSASEVKFWKNAF